jgi:hypothetical protein
MIWQWIKGIILLTVMILAIVGIVWFIEKFPGIITIIGTCVAVITLSVVAVYVIINVSNIIKDWFNEGPNLYGT